MVTILTKKLRQNPIKQPTHNQEKLNTPRNVNWGIVNPKYSHKINLPSIKDP